MQTRALAFTNKLYSKTLPLNEEFYESYLHLDDSISQTEFTNMLKMRPNLINVNIVPSEDNIVTHEAITKIPTISSLKNLQYLSFNYIPITEIPRTLINLLSLNCHNTLITEIPDTLINLHHLCCHNTPITEIPDTLINLQYLCCHNTSITKIPDTLVNLEELYCYETSIKEIPNTLINLNTLNCKTTFVQNIPNTLVKLEMLTCDRTVDIPKNLQEKQFLKYIYIYILVFEIRGILLNVSQELLVNHQYLLRVSCCISFLRNRFVYDIMNWLVYTFFPS